MTGFQIIAIGITVLLFVVAYLMLMAGILSFLALALWAYVELFQWIATHLRL